MKAPGRGPHKGLGAGPGRTERGGRPTASDDCLREQGGGVNRTLGRIANRLGRAGDGSRLSGRDGTRFMLGIFWIPAGYRPSPEIQGALSVVCAMRLAS